MTEFAADFDRQQMAILGEDRAQGKLDIWRESFQNLCIKSRRKKKPILTFVLQDKSNESFRVALQPVFQSSAALDAIKSEFIVAGFAIDELPMPQF